jgi:phosphotransacetylase
MDTHCDVVQDVNYWGTMAVAAGDADGMVSGCAHDPVVLLLAGTHITAL